MAEKEPSKSLPSLSEFSDLKELAAQDDDVNWIIKLLSNIDATMLELTNSIERDSKELKEGLLENPVFVTVPLASNLRMLINNYRSYRVQHSLERRTLNKLLYDHFKKLIDERKGGK